MSVMVKQAICTTSPCQEVGLRKSGLRTLDCYPTASFIDCSVMTDPHGRGRWVRPDRVRDAMNKRGWNLDGLNDAVKEVCRRRGIAAPSRQNVADILSGRYISPRIGNVILVAEALGVSLDYLTDRTSVPAVAKRRTTPAAALAEDGGPLDPAVGQERTTPARRRASRRKRGAG